MLGFDGEYSACHAKARFWCFLVKNRKKSPVKHFIENHILLNFVNLYTAFRPTIPGRNIPDNSFLIIFNPLPPKLQCWIWQNSPHSTLCFNSEIGGGENHELSGNFCQRLSELKKKKGNEEFKILRILKYCQLTFLFDEKRRLSASKCFLCLLERSVDNFCFRGSLLKIKINIWFEFVQNGRQACEKNSGWRKFLP